MFVTWGPPVRRINLYKLNSEICNNLFFKIMANAFLYGLMVLKILKVCITCLNVAWYYRERGENVYIWKSWVYSILYAELWYYVEIAVLGRQSRSSDYSMAASRNWGFFIYCFAVGKIQEQKENYWLFAAILPI